MSELAIIRFDELRAVRDLLQWSHFGHPAAEVDDIEALLVAVPAFSHGNLEFNLLRGLATQDLDRRASNFANARQRLPSIVQSLNRIRAALHQVRVPPSAEDFGFERFRVLTPPDDGDRIEPPTTARVPEHEGQLAEPSAPTTRRKKDWSSLDASLRTLTQPIEELGLAVDQALLIASLPWVMEAESGTNLLSKVQLYLARASDRFSDRFAQYRMCGRVQWDRDGLSLLGRFVWPIAPPSQAPSDYSVAAQDPERDILLIDLDQGDFAHAWVNRAAGVATVRAHFRAPPPDQDEAGRRVADRFANTMGGAYAGMTS